MKAAWIFTILTLACVRVAAAAASTFEKPIVPDDPDKAGRELVAHLLSIRPGAPGDCVTNNALLAVRRKGGSFEVPLQIETRVTETNWTATYRTQGTNKEHAASFSLTCAANRPNEYRVWKFSRPPGDTNEFEVISGPEAFIPFAGSDFWLAEFGMEYLRWPTQRLVKKEVCRSQACDKLESIAPASWTGAYVRVVSWFDIDTGGPVLVEAYDAKGMVKEFKPNKFSKVDGQWKVDELEMNSWRKGSRSTLRFLHDEP